ncbi:TlpA disulfide reductase family protein [Pedobacter frigidisoli]|uniref:TlpA family protein disulfide reductase n=1 Tax=Pedobacter frigidisoli TaxID=2530455 RepID=UPI00292CF147|nr:TlpA disulfide reductase family protein [Pedobacter frigidisoli]
MLKKTLFFLLFTVLLGNVKAQTKPANKLDEQSVVRAEDGNVYPYAVWRKLLSTGKYAIKNRKTFTDSGKPEYLLYELSDEQKEAYFDKMPKPRKSDNFAEGEEFKGFKATDMNGNKFDLRNAKDKVIVLNFWFINCPPCRSEIPQLNELVEQYKDNKDVIFLAIATDDRYDLKNFIKTNPFQYNIVDSGRSIAEKYNLRLYPTHVVIDKNGIIKFGTVGLASNTMHWLKRSIDESLALN